MKVRKYILFVVCHNIGFMLGTYTSVGGCKSALRRHKAKVIYPNVTGAFYCYLLNGDPNHTAGLKY